MHNNNRSRPAIEGKYQATGILSFIIIYSGKESDSV